MKVIMSEMFKDEFAEEKQKELSYVMRPADIIIRTQEKEQHSAQKGTACPKNYGNESI